MFADNLVSAVLLLLENKLSYNPINKPGIDTPIKEIINYISKCSGFRGNIVWDESKPDGALHKLLDSSIIKSYGWDIAHPLSKSLADTYYYYADHLSKLRR